MMIQEALRTELATTTALTALIGDRISPIRLPRKSAYPAITYQLISDPQWYVMGGDSDLNQPRIQVNCYAKTYTACIAVAAQVKTALEDFTGKLGGDSGVTVQHVYFNDEGDNFDEAADLFWIRHDYIIWYYDGS